MRWWCGRRRTSRPCLPTPPEPSAPPGHWVPLARLAQMVPEVRWVRLEPLVPRVRWVPPVVSVRTAPQECWAQLEVSVSKEQPGH